jgi:GNAT superfamily N-acetyltransferase
VAVDDKYRGKGLQRELIRWREIDSELHGFKYEMATVSPRNIASLKSLIREGYEPIAHAFLKSRNNVERLLMFRRSF